MQCMNNFKQLQTAYRMYVDDNNDNLPLNNIGSGAGVSSWIAYNTPGTSVQYDYNTVNLRNGTLYPYNRNPKIYDCPANAYLLIVGEPGAPPGPYRNDSGQIIIAPTVPETRTCSIEYSLGGAKNAAGTITQDGYTWNTYRKFSQLLPNRISTKIVFVDEASGSVDDGAFALWPMNTFNYWWNVPGSRHNRGCVLSFADGHVEYHKWLGTEVAGNPMQTAGPGNGGQGFTSGNGARTWQVPSDSGDQADFAWVQAGGPQYP